MKNVHQFTKKLIHWHRFQNDRNMPWKGELDPYKIWLSEIILQQTRVQQGWKYYEKFISRYPTIDKLAAAADEEVFKMWEGLGYYTRCRNLLHTARYITDNFKGVFPKRYEDVITLKGVGPYTAAAIVSFAYKLPFAVVDGNVFRVLARYFGDAIPIDSKEGKKHFTTLAQKLLYVPDSAQYNQAIMDFGATVCKPQIPRCSECIMQADCVAFKNGLVNKLPIKENRLTRTTRWFYYFLFTYKGSTWVCKRIEKDIWQSLFEFYLLEGDKVMDWNPEDMQTWMSQQLGIKVFTVTNKSKTYRQQLTHQTIYAQFISVTLIAIPKSLKHMELIKLADLKMLAFPGVINTYLNERSSQTAMF